MQPLLKRCLQFLVILAFESGQVNIMQAHRVREFQSIVGVAKFEHLLHPLCCRCDCRDLLENLVQFLLIVLCHGQATRWPGLTSSIGGGATAHSALAIGQRVLKPQPEGFFRGVGTSPSSTMRFSFLMFGSGRGIADNRALV